MGLAKEAAVRSVGLLRPRDQVAVIAFDSVAQVVVPLREVRDGAGLREAIGRIYAGGGTEIYPALRAAYFTLAGAEADLRHVILLTDGRSGSSGDYGALTRQMQEAGITLSTVAVGADADTLLLEALAQAGGGRYYFTESPGAIPEIFTRETSLIARSLAVNLRFHPAAAAPSPLLRGLTHVPPLEGYVAATPKERAEVALVSPEGDPVLAAWQYGAGRAVAWTSDLGGRWAGAWARSPAFATLWGNVLGWVLPGARSGSLQVQAAVAADGSVTLTAETPGDWTVTPVRATVVGPDGQGQEVELPPAGPGAYRSRLTGLAPGAYVATITRELPGEASQRAEVAWVTPYPAEYRAMGVDRTALERLAAAGKGRVLTDPREAMAGPVAPVRARVPLAPFLLVLAGLTWPLEIAGRRLVLTGEDWGRALAWVRRRLPWARPGRAAQAEGALGPGAAAAAPGLGRLQAARERVRRRQGLLGEGPRGEGAGAPATGLSPEADRPFPERRAAGPEEPAAGTGPAPSGTEPAPPAAAGTAADGGTPAPLATAQRLLAAKRRVQHRGSGR
ncbi:MAG: VWA domain-containing protein [Firmicutes bacterium]|nr:VWA domain-containing protein [Bacillota bacterium]